MFLSRGKNRCVSRKENKTNVTDIVCLLNMYVYVSPLPCTKERHISRTETKTQAKMNKKIHNQLEGKI